jgi:hypothetical protein
MRLTDPGDAETRARAYLDARHRGFVAQIEVMQTRRSGQFWILKGTIVFKKSRLVVDQRFFTLQLRAATGAVTHYRLATSAKHPGA